MAKVEYGLQMYSVRDITKYNMEGALREVSKQGYRYIEFAGFFDHPAEEIRRWLDEYGLVCSGTHTGVDAIKPDQIAGTIDYHHKIGCGNLIVPGAKWGTLQQMNENIALFNEAEKILGAEGIALGYHNHSAEFLPTPYGKVIENEIIENTKIELEIDTFWAFNAGIDVIPFLDGIKDRIRVIHLKDGFRTPKQYRKYDTATKGAIGKSVGSGEAPVKAVREWAIKNNVLMVIESEGLDPNGLGEVKRCIDFLRTLD